MSQQPRLTYLVTEDHYFYSHRLPMARAALRAGYDVSVVTNVKKHRERIEAEGIRVIPLSLDRRSLNPFKAVWHITKLIRIYGREKPDVVHHIAMKPVLYGGLAAFVTRVPVVINAFAGLGYLFTVKDLKARIVRLPVFTIFRFLLRRPESHLLLQNDDDLAVLRGLSMTPAEENRIVVIRGSGVDMDHYQPLPQPPAQPDIVCAFAGRLIGIKGLAALRDAFAILQTRAPHIKLWLCGTPDEANPGSWTMAQVWEWTAANPQVVYKGFCEDMRRIWAQAHIALQPSYGGEGIPKALLEAAACARAIVATDVAGCRDVVDQAVNGYLVPPRDAAALAAAIEMLAADPERCALMGQKSRDLVFSKGFSADSVSALTKDLYSRFIK